MAIVKCENGHYYDNAKFESCPHCGEERDDEQMTVQIDSKTMQHFAAIFMEENRKKSVKSDYDDQVTVGLHSAQNGNDFLVGWLVCIEGPEKGRDYRLYHGFNHIGRNQNRGIAIADDDMIARKDHCSVVYDDRKNEFYVVAQGNGLTYLNGENLEGSAPLKTGDILEIGASKLEFVAFCREGRVWSKE